MTPEQATGDWIVKSLEVGFEYLRRLHSISVWATFTHPSRNRGSPIRSVEMLSARRRKDYAAQSAADALVAQAGRMGMGPHDGGDGEDGESPVDPDAATAAAAAAEAAGVFDDEDAVTVAA